MKATGITVEDREGLVGVGVGVRGYLGIFGLLFFYYKGFDLIGFGVRVLGGRQSKWRFQVLLGGEGILTNTRKVESMCFEISRFCFSSSFYFVGEC